MASEVSRAKELALVIIELTGGNDGLNTIVPFEDDVYYRSRPKLAIRKSKVLKLNDHLGLQPSLAPFRDMMDDEILSIIESVRYPNSELGRMREPTRSTRGKLLAGGILLDL